ncbi:MAG: undecaprenyl-diphosphate phosphatase [Candidatus Nanopelagicales bacterium]
MSAVTLDLVAAAATATEQVTWFEAVVLGVLQGLTEFLPISSSAHLLIASQLFGWGDPGAAFTAVTQIGTETAVILFFRKDIGRIISAWARSLVRPELRSGVDARMGWYVILGTIPIGVLGFLFADQIETVARNLWLVASMLILFGVLLGVADALGSRTKTFDDLTIRDGLLFGLAQSLALIPGVSRSGATITGGLAMGYTRATAARYAFLLAIPAVLASGLFEALKIGDQSNAAWGPTILATAIAFVIGYAVIAWLMHWLSTRSYLPFVVYRIVLGLLVIVLLLTGTLSAT